MIDTRLVIGVIISIIVLLALAWDNRHYHAVWRDDDEDD